MLYTYVFQNQTQILTLPSPATAIEMYDSASHSNQYLPNG